MIPWSAFWSGLGWGLGSSGEPGTELGEPGTDLGRIALHLWVGGVGNAPQMIRSGSADNRYLHYLLVHFSGEGGLKVLFPLPFLSNSV